jgi:hypothetical protein
MNPNDYYRMKSAEVRAVAVAIWEVVCGVARLNNLTNDEAIRSLGNG